MAKPRLALIVPYRDRPQHLAAFVPHIMAYFERDKLDRDIPYSLMVVEQGPGAPFSRSITRNIGYLLSRARADYVCFHDIDYLPVWADYSWPELPTCAVWYGAEERPIRPGRSPYAVQHLLDNFYGGVMLMRNEQFEAANGYSTQYWGWGLQDLDLARRLEAKGFALQRRKGTFRPLDHDHDGFTDAGELSEDAKRNRALYDARWVEGRDLAAIDRDGLNTTRFEITDRRPLLPQGRGTMEIVTVSFEGPRIDAANPGAP